ncbi:uncharacterized protein LOC126750366 isoform X2 [Anthonomus grandis grandis]|nr:uncharacterized protein LOC126750366 isoform X2 [Anthonomus grandis grandis]XP_050315918.1 uncharacterized protein LOC126750366 isoform X2 [Anthonomus grandis grandis]XP_050315919.1 uncharacterized protein LOC126750366 isoform X2 [Anthonomus grandis grandis]XP_050315920.1 uncharacterized protein LOC126750366 isoform X2 [Anthonomus grandis grandis]
MFAVVEFDNKRKEFSVVPLTWLTDDKTVCFWPKIIRSEDHLQSMIQKCFYPTASWDNYAIKKIHCTTESFHIANCMLKMILEESSSANEEPQATQKKGEEIDRKDIKRVLPENSDVVISYSSDSDTFISAPKKKKRKKFLCPLPTTHNNDSNEIEVFLSDSEQKGTALLTSVESVPSVGSVLSIPDELDRQQQASHNEHNSTRRIQSNVNNNSPTSDFLSNNHLNEWQHSISQELEHIKAVQERQATMLRQIWQALQVKNIQALHRPADVPDLPLNKLREFGNFEQWLKIEHNFIYMRTRIASIGGTTVRAAVMNMMKCLLTNKLGMAFNWAGSAPKSTNQKRKYAFKDTRTYQIINEASKIRFSGEKLSPIVGESTDKAIGQACQAWLKQSKHRFLYSENH